jgi:superfamily II RNA helicase
MPLLAGEKLYGPVREYLHRPRGGGHRHDRPDFGHILAVLKTFHLTPAIFFLKSRAECDAALKSCRRHTPDAASDPFPLVRDELLDRFPYLANHKQLAHLDNARVAAHHGGQLPAWKFLVETLMKQGCLDAIFATSTVAAGVNFPARTIVLFNSDLFDGQAFSPMNGTEFHQMTGRAGRRGKDKIGFLLAIPGRFMDLTHVRDLLFKAPEAVQSRIRSDFSMVLNLLLSQTPEDIREIFASSFAAFQQKRGFRSGCRAFESRRGHQIKTRGYSFRSVTPFSLLIDSLPTLSPLFDPISVKNTRQTFPTLFPQASFSAYNTIGSRAARVAIHQRDDIEC